MGAAGIGVAVGAGFYVEAVIGVTLLLVSVKLLPDLIFRIQFKKLKLVENHVYLTIENYDRISDVMEQVEDEFKHIDKINIKDKVDGTLTIELFVLVDAEELPTTTYGRLKKIEGITLIDLHT